jgi:hypothetical protein
MRLYHYLESKWALDDIRRQRLKLSKIDDMNDPYEWECVRSSHEPWQLTLGNTKRDIVERHGVLCFSRSWNNILMWSHYGDRHRGICLGFDVNDEHTREVAYVGDILIVGNLNDGPREERRRILDCLYGAKYEGWSYEREVRVHGSRAELDEETRQYFVNFDEHLILKEVVAGARFSMSKRPIEDALQGYSGDVKILKARPCPRRFEIIVDEDGFGSVL